MYSLYSVYEFAKSPIASFESENVDELARTILHLHRNWPRLAELVRGMDHFNIGLELSGIFSQFLTFS
jgi:hypothetical protein